MKEINMSIGTVPEVGCTLEKRISIMLVDDNEIFRYGLRLMLQQEKDTDIVGDWPLSNETLARISNLNPDVVLIVSHGQNRNYVDGIWYLKRSDIQYKGDVILLADSEDECNSAIDAGASGYLVNKDITCSKLVQYIRNIHENHQVQGENAEELVRLVVPSFINIGQFLRFTNQLETILHKNSNVGCIVKISGNFKKGAIVIIALGHMTTCEFFNELHHMPAVMEIDELNLSKSINVPHLKEYCSPVTSNGEQGTTVIAKLSEPFKTHSILEMAAA
jgi:DNA-binding NarL/FixJ family response regulator